MLYDRTKAVLEQQKMKRSLNPFTYLWIGFQHFAYFFAPAGENPCVYCWLCRVFVLGLIIGWHLTYLWFKR